MIEAEFQYADSFVIYLSSKTILLINLIYTSDVYYHSEP